MSKKEKEAEFAVEEFSGDRQLTKRQTLIYNYIKGYIDKSGYSPSLKELAEEYGSKSLEEMHNHINALIKKGFIKKTRTRTLELIEKIVENEANTVTIEMSEKEFKSDKLELSDKASEIAESLKRAEDSPDKGKIAAIDMETGNYYIGKSIIEAVKEGRKKKNDPKAIFYSVRIGFPTVHVLKSIALQGEIYQERFPKVQAVVIEKELHFKSEISQMQNTFGFIIDTGFTGSIISDSDIIENLDADFITFDEVILAGGTKVQVKEFTCKVWINNIVYENILITQMNNEFLVGMDFMQQICKRAIFDFEKDKVVFED